LNITRCISIVAGPVQWQLRQLLMSDSLCAEVKADWRSAHARGTGFTREQISYKVREHSHAKVPVIIALGKQEVEKRTVHSPLGQPEQEFVGWIWR